MAAESADFFAKPGLSESPGLVQRDAASVFGKDCSLQRPDAVLLRLLNESFEKCFADALSPYGGSHVDRNLRHACLHLAWGDAAQRRPGYDVGFCSHDQTGMLVMVGVPLFPAGRFRFEGRISSGDAFLIDRLDDGPVFGPWVQ